VRFIPNNLSYKIKLLK